MQLIEPQWGAPTGVRALFTCRSGGVSEGPYAALNLATHVGDCAAAVAENRRRLAARLPSEPLWLEQVHGNTVHHLGLTPSRVADAAVARGAAGVCAVMVADCLPVLLCDEAGSVVAAAHAGWRGLADGVLANTVAAMEVAPQTLRAWLGPAIGVQAFEVGAEVRERFLALDPALAQHFYPGRGERWMADLAALARHCLQTLGVRAEAIYGGKDCTYADPARFFSYRRDGVCGRMAALIWIADPVR